jgi:hypothetical protein
LPAQKATPPELGEVVVVVVGGDVGVGADVAGVIGATGVVGGVATGVEGALPEGAIEGVVVGAVAGAVAAAPAGGAVGAPAADGDRVPTGPALTSVHVPQASVTFPFTCPGAVSCENQ